MNNLKSKIESLLFISAKPMSVKQLTELIDKKKEKEIKEACDILVEEYKESKKGIQIIKNGSKYQMVTAPENSEIVQAMIKDETTGELSRPSLETLTIIAYRGPICKIELEKIRGVNCSMILRNLLLRGLVEMKVDSNTEDEFYNVTFDFIRFLGINDVTELPDYERLSKDEVVDQIIGEEKEEGGLETKEDEKSGDFAKTEDSENNVSEDDEVDDLEDDNNYEDDEDEYAIDDDLDEAEDKDSGDEFFEDADDEEDHEDEEYSEEESETNNSDTDRSKISNLQSEMDSDGPYKIKVRVEESDEVYDDEDSDESFSTEVADDKEEDEKV